MRGDDQGDLWSYDVDRRHVRQIAVAVTKEKPKDDQKEWLEEQQLELIHIVKKRKDFDEREKRLARKREPFRPQEIPVEEGARLFQLQLSPDGRYVTFLWQKKPSEEERTSYMEFVELTGYATEKNARPKVGEALAEYKMGFVRVDPMLALDDIEVSWVDDGIEKDTVLHGPFSEEVVELP